MRGWYLPLCCLSQGLWSEFRVGLGAKMILLHLELPFLPPQGSLNLKIKFLLFSVISSLVL